MDYVTRFAPSPTGFLHIGGARTALFNWLLAKHYGGKFLLRLEDTDRVRSTVEAVEAIFKGLLWLGVTWDEEPVFQFSRAGHHRELAEGLVESGMAYRCYCTAEELNTMRETARANGASPKYTGVWRDRDPREAPPGLNSVIRLRAPQTGETTLHDLVQGTVTVKNSQLDDMVLVRGDGTPTFMLSVVVDDHDMGITHVIRGDDHLTNTFRQLQIYQAFGWDPPEFGHIPLIHGPDGVKLSKRHGALGVESYRDMGFLPEALCNYLLKLGWSHGDDEFFSMEQAIDWFSTDNLGKSAARLDFAKMKNLNGRYIRESSHEKLLQYLLELMGETSEEERERLLKGMNGLKQRARTLLELRDIAKIYVGDFNFVKVDAASEKILGSLLQILESLEEWTEASLEFSLRRFVEVSGVSFGEIAQLLRNVLTGEKITPSIFEMLWVFGRGESLHRIGGSLSM
ncbi:MAG: glutamate--tRNA ligase [Holosporaceae bacterium]|jgi:glutamyl-tRNA synthetase|nr:glutamate--tRNA ligase [Holosporaceae bacterium]